MKNSLNISVAGEDLISTVDDSTNRLFINGSEISSASWTGSGTYSTTVNGHAMTITQVEDTTGNVAIRRTAAYTYELYKIKTGTTIDGDLSVTGSISEGGVKLEDKYPPFPTEYVSDLTWADWQNTKTLTWTVHGSGFVYVTASTRSANNNDTATAYAEILLNGNLVAVDLTRLSSAATIRLSANASVMMNVKDEDVITVNLNNSKGGTAEGYRRAMAFGCTLTQED